MSVETTLVTALQAAGLTVYPLRMPTNPALPCVVYQRIDTPQIETHGGVAMEYPRMQLTCWGNRFGDVVTTAGTVKQVLDPDQAHFKHTQKVGEADLEEPEVNLYRRVLDYILWT